MEYLKFKSVDNKSFAKQLELRTKKFAIEIIQELEWIESKRLNNLMKEANELLAMFTSIEKNLN